MADPEDDDDTPTLEIAPSKVVHIIFQSREGRMAEAEIRAFISGLNED